MSDRLAKQVAERLRFRHDSWNAREIHAAIPALARLVDRADTLRQEVVDLAPSDNYLPSMVEEYDDALRAVAAALGVAE